MGLLIFALIILAAAAAIMWRLGLLAAILHRAKADADASTTVAPPAASAPGGDVPASKTDA